MSSAIAKWLYRYHDSTEFVGTDTKDTYFGAEGLTEGEKGDD